MKTRASQCRCDPAASSLRTRGCAGVTEAVQPGASAVLCLQASCCCVGGQRAPCFEPEPGCPAAPLVLPVLPPPPSDRHLPRLSALPPGCVCLQARAPQLLSVQSDPESCCWDPQAGLQGGGPLLPHSLTFGFALYVCSGPLFLGSCVL